MEKSTSWAAWTAAWNGHTNVVRLLIKHRANIDLPDVAGGTPLCTAAQHNRTECIALLAAAKASLEGAMTCFPITTAADAGADDSVRLLAHLGSRLVMTEAPYQGLPFWNYFNDNKGRVRDPKVWEWIVRRGGDEGTPESLRKRIRLLKKAGVHDPRD